MSPNQFDQRSNTIDHSQLLSSLKENFLAAKNLKHECESYNSLGASKNSNLNLNQNKTFKRVSSS